MKINNLQDLSGIVFSTNPDFSVQNPAIEKNELVPQKQLLRIELDRRNGKPATLVTDFKGTDIALKELAKTLKIRCGVGGSQRDGEILIQGDFRKKVAEILTELGYKIRKIGW